MKEEPDFEIYWDGACSEDKMIEYELKGDTPEEKTSATVTGYLHTVSKKPLRKSILFRNEIPGKIFRQILQKIGVKFIDGLSII